MILGADVQSCAWRTWTPSRTRSWANSNWSSHLRAENAGLQAKLDELTTPARSADNLAEGVQNALDGLADRLGAMTNATSNFAVREFTLESKVHVDVTAVGTIGFQFVRPGEMVNAAALSTVTLTAVPVPVPKPVPDVVLASRLPVPYARPPRPSRRSTGCPGHRLRGCVARASRRRRSSRAWRPGRQPRPSS